MSKFHDVSMNIDHRRMKHSLFDSSWWDASNGGIFMSLASIDEKIFAFFCFETFGNISLTIDARDIKIPSLDASHHDESNKLCLVLLQSLDAEISWFNWPELELSRYFCQVGVYGIWKIENLLFSCINKIFVKFCKFIKIKF